MASHSRVRRVGRWTGALLLLLPVAALAQEFAEHPDDPSAFTTRIEARDYDDRFETVADVLAHVPGVQVRRFGGLGSFSTAGIRGSKSEQVLILLDGVRLNSAQRGTVDLSTLPLRQVETIEVLRGGGGARWGSDAVGGVISITTRRPDEEQGLDLSALAGSLGTLGADALVHGTLEPFDPDSGLGPLRTTLAWSRLRSDNDFRFERGPGASQGGLLPIPRETFTRLNADFVQDSGLLKGALATGPHSELQATAHLHRTDRGQPGPVTRGRTDESVSCTHAAEQYRRAVLQLDWLHRALGPGAFEGSVFHRSDSDELHDPGGICGLVDTRGADTRDRSRATDQQTGIDLRYATRFRSVGPVRLQTRSAFGLRRDAVRARGTDATRRLVTSFFLQEEIALGGGRLRLLPALGFEAAHANAVATTDPGSGAPVRVSPDGGAEWLPRIGAILRLAPGLRLKSNYRRSYRRPNFNELYFPDMGYLRGNPYLRPEEGWSFDVGLELARSRLGPLRDLRLDVVWFDHDYERSIEFVQVNQFTTQPVNVSPSTARGWELEGGVVLARILELSGSYTWFDSEVRVAGGDRPPLPHRPRQQAFGRAALRFGPASIWTELLFEDDVTRTTTGRLRTEGATQLDLGLGVELASLPGLRRLPTGWFLSSEWLNVTDVSRVDSLGMPLPGRLWYLRLRGRLAGAGRE